MDDYTPILTPEEREARRKARAAARRKKQQLRRRRMLLHILPAAILGLTLAVTLAAWSRGAAETSASSDDEPLSSAVLFKAAPPEMQTAFCPAENADTLHLGDEIYSSYAVLVDLQTDAILAEKEAQTVINPASMTKVLTLLVAAEQLEEADLDDTFTMTIEITDYCYVNGCSVVGLDVGETVPIRELLYGTILPSGADAALGLAMYTAGSHEAFVDLMNAKLEELGIADTAHFTNCVGLYDENHHCTVTDMAVILQAAMENDLCRQVLSAHTYETLPTPQHPEGQVLSNWFLRKIEDHDTDQAVRAVGAKTGYVVQSGSCAASWGEDAAGNQYICVTADAGSSWQAIFDHAALYKSYCGSETTASGTSA